MVFVYHYLFAVNNPYHEYSDHHDDSRSVDVHPVLTCTGHFADIHLSHNCDHFVNCYLADQSKIFPRIDHPLGLNYLIYSYIRIVWSNDL